MRLWSIHPRHLDRQGLVALWREALLAQAVLAGRTRGYRNHPQLERFRATSDPVGTIGTYLTHVAADADSRGYRFDATKIISPVDPEHASPTLPVSSGQLDFEMERLRLKLQQRSPKWLAALDSNLAPHPCFHVIVGPKAEWERG